jgi:NitT/TauT family transport system substrate-binding protein
VAVTSAAALVVAACGGGASPSPSPAASVDVAVCNGQDFAFQLSFIPNVQHIGFILASERGFYEEEGLNVELIPAGPNVDPVGAVGDGTADAGLVDYGQLLRARAAGVPIVSIAQNYKKTFLNWFSLKTAGITTMADWEGKRVGRTQVGDDPEIIAMLASADLTTDDIETIQQDFAVDSFLAGEVDLATGVVFFHPAIFNIGDQYVWPDDFDVFVPEEHGAPIASQTVATIDEKIAADPAALSCFLRGSIRGWQAAFEDPEGAVTDMMNVVNPDAFPEAHQRASVNEVLAIVGEGPDDNLLQIDREQYVESIRILEEVDFIEPGANVDDTFDTSLYDAMGPIE